MTTTNSRLSRMYKFFYGDEDIELPVPYKECNCSNKFCKGLFVPTMENQTECLFSIREKQQFPTMSGDCRV